MAFTHGSLATMAIDANGGTSYTDVTTYLKEASPATDISAAETTTLGKTAKNYIPELEDGKFSLSGFLDSTGDAFFWSCKRKLVSFRYRPAGVGTGLPEYTGKCIMTSYKVAATVSDVSTISADFQISDGISRATQP